MTTRTYDRLSPLDASMLAIEDHDVHMHMGGASIFEAGPLWRDVGGLDIERVREYVASRLHNIPRYRQRLDHTPLAGDPIWIDDPRFNLGYHVRHTSLPAGAGERELKRLVGRILSQQLDRGKPLWEMWFVEGCGERRFALVTKIHHCMVDGIGGIDLMSALMSDRPDAPAEPRTPWIAQPPPSRLRLAAEELVRGPVALLRDAKDALSEPRETLETLSNTVSGLGDAAATNLKQAPETPLNVPIGPHRRVDWLRMDLDAVREVKARLGGTVNDVVLTLVTGAMSRFLAGRGVDASDLDFRALIPVNTRSARAESMGNQVSQLVASLPVDEPDPRKRLKRLVETTRALKDSQLPRASEALEKLFDWTVPRLFGRVIRAGSRFRMHNVLVSNIPGPREPVYLLGARQVDVFPVIPLFQNQSVAIGVFGYERTLCWGFNSDWDAVPDLHELVEAVETDFSLLQKQSA
jgi:WS/DGAT/MGAT family acyltransferase